MTNTEVPRGNAHGLTGGNPKDRLPFDPEGGSQVRARSKSRSHSPSRRSRSRSSSPPPGGSPQKGASALSLLASLSTEQQTLVELLAKELAAKEVEQLKQSGGAANGLNVSTGDPTVVTALPGLLYKTNDEVHTASFNEDYPIHDEILTLARNGYRTPLTLFTNKTLRTLQFDATSYRKKHTVGQSTYYLLDASAFGREDQMSLKDWKEAYPTYLLFLGKVAEPEIVERWTDHFNGIVKLEDFEQSFEAMRHFDIEERCKYHARRFAFDAVVYHRNLDRVKALFEGRRQQAKIDALEERVSRLSGPVRPDRSSSVPVRHQPYVSAYTSSSKPFSPGNLASAVRRLCLKCGRPDCQASTCSNNTTFRGRPVGCRWDAARRTLISILDDKFDFCFDFNRGGPDKCKGQHGTRIRHACSICGSFDHCASSGDCSA